MLVCYPSIVAAGDDCGCDESLWGQSFLAHGSSRSLLLLVFSLLILCTLFEAVVVVLPNGIDDKGATGGPIPMPPSIAYNK